MSESNDKPSSPPHKPSRNHSTDTLRTKRSQRSHSREGDRDRDKRERRRDDRRRSRSRDRYRNRDRSRDRSRDKYRDRDRERRRDRDRDSDRERDRDRQRHRHRDYDRDDKRRKREDDDHDERHKRKRTTSPAREQKPSNGNRNLDDMDEKPTPQFESSPIRRPSPSYEAPQEDYNPDEPKEDDSEARSVFVSQLAARLTARDLGYFFEDKLGDNTVMDARIVTDRLSRRSKGIGYVEFRNIDLVEKALNLSGTVVMGLPIMVQLTESERNKTHAGDGNLNLPPGVNVSHHGAILYVGSLHFNLTESDIKQVFEPFGELEFVDLHRDPMTGRSKGYAFVQYKRADDAKMALEQMEGFELAGRTLRVNTVHEKGTARYTTTDSLDDAGGGNLNAASRQALMQKLARIDAPQSLPEVSKPHIPQAMQTRSVLLKNMFDPEEETERDWDKDLAEDVKLECSGKYGSVNAIKIEKDSQGEIYVRFDTIESAKSAVQGLNGRYFGGRTITAVFISDALMQAHI